MPEVRGLKAGSRNEASVHAGGSVDRMIAGRIIFVVTAVATNRKAFRDYTVIEKFEVGIELAGTEVKSLRQGNVSLDEGFARVENGEVFLYSVHIAPYEQGNIFNKDPRRRRKLLLHRHEIKRLFGKATLRGLTLIPLKIYFNQRGLAKLELALCRGKKHADRREELKKRAMERDERVAQGRR
jgi:SsrA-binding protein